MSWVEEDIITTDKYLSLNCHKNISYHKTDVFHRSSFIWRGERHTIRPNVVWISGHSDYPITSTLYNQYSDKCTAWFTVNKDYDAPNLFALPLGITNNTTESGVHPIYGNTRIMWEAVQSPRNIKNIVYMNFSLETYKAERSHVFSLFADKKWVTTGRQINTLEGRRMFLSELRDHKFVLCPRGNGIDTHRLWETLYMGSIPIVRRELALQEFNDLPICWIDKWEDITVDFLESKYIEISSRTWNMEKLKIKYWLTKIQEVASAK